MWLCGFISIAVYQKRNCLFFLAKNRCELTETYEKVKIEI